MATKKRYASQAKTAHWALTLNPKLLPDKVTIDEEPFEPDFDEVCMRYMVTVKHSADLDHWHVYIQFRSQKTMRQVKECIGYPRAHCEPVKSKDKYEEYLCDGHTTIEGPHIYGTPIRQGHRSDFERLLAFAKEGKSKREIYEDSPGLLRYPTSVSTAVSEFAPEPPIRRPIKVYLLWGPTNTGKTYRARLQYPFAYLWRGRYVEGKWADGYRSQSVLILDEWLSSQWPLTTMNSLLDEFVSPILARYGNKFTLWNTVVITTNETPEEIYYGDPHRQTFWRRITDVSQIVDWTHPADIFSDDVVLDTPPTSPVAADATHTSS